MPYYVVSYDLHKGRDYVRAHQGIVAVSNNVWAKPLESFYIIHSQKSAIEVRDYLRSYLDSDDSLVVILTELKDWAMLNIDLKALEWIKGESS